MQNISQVSFNGKFIKHDKLKSKQAKSLNRILETKCNGASNEELLASMPFDVDVFCLNLTKRAINPRFNFWITKTKQQATLQGCIKLTSKDTVEENASKLSNFINGFHKKFASLKGDERLTRAE